MEDAHTTILEFEEEKETSFFGVFDGHGGVGVARYAGANCHKRILTDPEFGNGNYSQALKNAFLGIDEDIQNDPNYINETSGCTAVTLLITKDDELFCSNAGDSRCVLSSAGLAVPLSFDHKPTNEIEIARITAAGGFVHFGRVNANLALSRAFGDFEFKRNPHLPPEKQAVTSDPDVIQRTIEEDDEFVVLACDGIWDVMTNQQVVNFVRSKIALGHELAEICELMVEKCLASDPSNSVGCDNMTIVIVGLLMGKDDADLQEKCKRVVSINGVTLNPLQSEGDAQVTAEAREESSSGDGDGEGLGYPL